MADTTIIKPQSMGKRTTRNTEIMLALCKSKSFVVFDRESTHYQPNDHYGKMIELSAVKIVDDRIVDTFDRLINPEMKISAKITELTGIDNEMVADASTYQKVVLDFINFCQGSVLVAHNAMSDIRYVNFFSSKMGIPFDFPYIDTINLCRWIDLKGISKVASTKLSLDEMARKYDVENNEHHRALNDAMVTAKLFIKIKSILHEEIEKYSTVDIPYLYENGSEDKDSKDEYNAKDAQIGKISFWEKQTPNKLYQRIYVRLILKDKTNDIYYDFATKNWAVKNSEFRMTDFDIMTGKIKNHLGLSDENKVYELSTYKKG